MLTVPHTLSSLHPFSSVGKKEGLAFGVYISITFLLCSPFELMCSHFGLSKETCAEPFPGSAASTTSLTFRNIHFPSTVLYPQPHPFQIVPFPLSPPLFAPAAQNTSHAANARKCHFHFFFSTVRVCSSLSLSRRSTCV